VHFQGKNAGGGVRAADREANKKSNGSTGSPQASKIKNTYKNSKMGNGNFADKYCTPT